MPLIDPTADDPVANMMDRLRLSWLHRHGKDGPARLLNIYRRDDGTLRWRPSGMPDQFWEVPDQRPSDLLRHYATVMHMPATQAGIVGLLNFDAFAGVAFVTGAWMVRASGNVAQMDQITAWAAEHGASQHPARIEVVNVYYAGRDGLKAMGTWEVHSDRADIMTTTPDTPPNERLAGNVVEALDDVLAAYAAAEARLNAFSAAVAEGEDAAAAVVKALVDEMDPDHRDGLFRAMDEAAAMPPTDLADDAVDMPDEYRDLTRPEA